MYNIKNAIISANRAIASTNAKAKIAYENNCVLIDGLRDVLTISAANTIPIPIPGPNNASVDKDAAITLADCNNIDHQSISDNCTSTPNDR